MTIRTNGIRRAHIGLSARMVDNAVSSAKISKVVRHELSHALPEATFAYETTNETSLAVEAVSVIVVE